jgi:hypothetical protein
MNKISALKTILSFLGQDIHHPDYIRALNSVLYIHGNEASGNGTSLTEKKE